MFKVVWFQKLLICSSVGLFACAAVAWADCTAGSCDHNGPREKTGCGSGHNECTGSETSCPNDNYAKILGSGFFTCLDNHQNKCNCRNSAQNKDVCFTEYTNCGWDEATGECVPDQNTANPDYDWIKIADNCDPGD